MSSDLQRIFDEDPLKLTRADIDEGIIAYYRKMREHFNLEGKVPKAKKEKVDAINLDDLLGGTPK